MMIGEQRRIEDEKRRFEDEKRRFEDKKRRFEDEKRGFEDEKRRFEDEKRRFEDKKRRFEDEKRKIEDEKRKIKDEKRKIEDEKRKIKEEKRKIEDEIKRRIKDGKRRAVREELINTADIYYQSCSEKGREAVKKFFNDINHDNDGKVKLHDFLEFMHQQGHANKRSELFNISELFETLDTMGRGTLQFREVLALVYIIQSGRPFCSGCKVFIPDMYFTCSKCYQSDNNDVIFLCPRCFRKKLYKHEESHGRDQFLDNYALLALERKQRITRSTQQRRGQRKSPDDIVPYVPPHPRHVHKWKPKLEEFQLVLQAVGLVHVIASSCTIL